jgi:glycosyltransferase involved in cell wall biosynthesis
MNNSTISIVIPVYNVEKYVKETLISVKNQNSEPDEVIIINDGSTDNSYEIIKEFSKLNKWKIFQTENQGLGLTRNYGKSLAKSEYIYFLDSDDILESNFIYEIREIINFYNKPDIILFSGKIFSDNETFNQKINLKFSLEGQYFRGDRLLTNLVKKKETLPQASRYITKKTLWTKNKLDYPAGIAEDEGLFFPLISLSENTVINPNNFYKYRVNRPGSITLDKPTQSHVKDYLNRILFTIEFINTNKKLVNYDIKAWYYNLERKCLKYTNLCLKTKSKISWKIVLKIFLQTKNFIFLLRILWRIIRNILK